MTQQRGFSRNAGEAAFFYSLRKLRETRTHAAALYSTVHSTGSVKTENSVETNTARDANRLSQS